MRGKLVRYSPELAAEVVRRLKAGESVNKLCQDPTMPSRGALRLWAQDHPAFGAEMEAARDAKPVMARGRFARAGPGRPCGYSPETAELVCHRLAEGCSLRQLACQLDLPSRFTLYQWMAEHPEFRAMYDLACEARTLLLYEEALEIADDDTRDLRPRADGKGVEPAREVLQRAKLRIDLRMRQAAASERRRLGSARARAEAARARPQEDEDFCWEDLLEELERQDAAREKTQGTG